MSKVIWTMQRLYKAESGQDLIEYALVAGRIGSGALVAISSLATIIAFGTAGNALTGAL